MSSCVLTDRQLVNYIKGCFCCWGGGGYCFTEGLAECIVGTYLFAACCDLPFLDLPQLWFHMGSLHVAQLGYLFFVSGSL